MKDVRIKVINWNWGAARDPEPFAYRPGYVFTNDPDCRDYDWLVVYDELKRPCERLACPRAHTILATCEPVSIKSYSRHYTRQFGHLLTNRPAEAEAHPHYHLGRGYYRWFNDRTHPENVAVRLPAKTRTVSAVCSSKQMRHTRHHDRFELISALAREIPDLDWYGHGVKGFGRKFEVLDPYKYHVTVENHVAPHHWTEKLADAFLCECLPFYAGAPDLADDFPAESFIPIPIDDPAEAVRIVRAAIAGNAYERRREAVLEARRLVLGKYNFWAQVIEVIESSADWSLADGAGPGGVVYARRELRKRNLGAALEDGLGHLRGIFGCLARRSLI